MDRSPVVSFARLDVPVALAELQAEVGALLDRGWVDHVNQRDYTGRWDVLPLRCQREHADAHPILQGFAIVGGEHWQDLPVLDHCPAIRGLLAALACPVESVRLMRLHAGAEIKPHRDPGLGLEHGVARMHVPVRTNASVAFVVDGERMPMQAGELWYFNADQVHAVHNRGDQDRIHLVIDCVANDWLVAKVQAGDPRHPAPG
ncbi:aspartyl/asparaginyl beta-hydroxylase domain-containing protein [Arenimonas sp.]|uniref:aspartyl/asparaginyl beta-hydroxylase domain-containing protein n=1 Tax=Arenimonas sp. TaxID=1872635 RepID=UPI002E34AEBE|nr:aspartyl/asparaginyl beta-hydroxylase domain-containing protein [Arenimonas sp.]HEX4854787.1 aspartyl/asparaginyl beta-hydroxylase domain-containing protein [Arenimonas sp.]